jgi:hypothetical protein
MEEEVAHQWRKKRRREKRKLAAESSHAEQRSFEDQLADAFDEDQQLEGLDSRLNEYLHVPRRWRSSSGKRYTLGGFGSGSYDEEVNSSIPSASQNPKSVHYL